MPETKPFDLVGVGLNTTDTLLFVERFPDFGGKASIIREIVSPGGQVASALSAASKLGMRCKYISTVGNDYRGEMQLASLRAAELNVDHVQIRADCDSQHSYIIVDESTGERTALSRRAACLELSPDRITETNITCARMLHLDGHDSPAIAKAAQIARAAGMPVSLDVDSIYPGFETVLPYIDYLVASQEFPERWTGEADPFLALEQIQNEYGMRVAAMTLGERGVLARANSSFLYSPGFAVDVVDTTGAGDIFHGAFCFGVLQAYDLTRTLEFAGAMAALNCTRMGARGGIATKGEVDQLVKDGMRTIDNDVVDRARR